MLRGLFTILPLLITVWLLRILFDLVNGNVTPWVVTIFREIGVQDLDRWQARLGFPIIGILITVLIIYVVGIIATNLAARRLFLYVESLILRVPIVKMIYGSARQLLVSFRVTGNRTFSKVVMIEYPRRGIWTVGFVTSEEEHRIIPGNDDGGISTVTVFLPTTPNPTSGWLVLTPRDEVRVLEMSIEEGLKFVVSGGIVSPGDLGDRIVDWSQAGRLKS